MTIDTSKEAVMTNQICRYCGLLHGVKCPSVKALEYHPDGSLKRVEFVTPTAAQQPLQPQGFQSAPNTSRAIASEDPDVAYVRRQMASGNFSSGLANCCDQDEGA